jgi:uncharacterized BrkB/YihY/UPF0761 family membrane protein
MWWTVAKEAAINWSSHNDARQGAALAYYSVFSLGPIILIAIAIAGLFFGHEAVTAQVISSLRDMLGDTGAKAIETMLAGASRPSEGALATILGIGALLFAAVGVVVQLKDALNVVWEMKDSEESGVRISRATTCYRSPPSWLLAFFCLFPSLLRRHWPQRGSSRPRISLRAFCTSLACWYRLLSSRSCSQ